MFDVHVVPHTHWDREWYRPLGRFRQRLVALVDELLDDPPPHGESFLLDGQAVVLEDYLEVRPERREALAALLREGRLQAGPWYVLADELIPSGEALVRNLLLGRRVLASSGAEAPPVLYCPDSFGHPATMPLLARGFGLPLVIAWRGFGGARWPAGDTFEWRTAAGGSVVLFHLPRSGYEYGSALPAEPDAAAARWTRMRRELGARSSTGVLLVQNGADHHALQPRYREALAALEEAAAPDDEVHPSSLRRFATALLGAAAERELPAVQGELRDSYGYTWTLQGTFATRAYQKRENARVERLLLREAEPFAALARLHGATSRLPLLVSAWRALLQCHPHDTLCGCSVDQVADAMDTRLADARVQGEGIVADALLDLARHDPVVARERRADWRPLVLVRNRAPRARGGVAIVQLKQFVADVPVGPGSAAPSVPADGPAAVRVHGTRALQPLQRYRAFDRTESPRHYPDNDLVSVTEAAIWTQPVPALGVVALEQRDGGRAGKGEVPNPVWGDSRSLENGRLRVEIGTDGAVALHDLPSGRRLEPLLAIEDRVDTGDLYTPSIRDVAGSARFDGARLLQKGPLRAVLRMRWRIEDARGRRTARDRLEIDLVLDADASFLRIEVRGENHRDDHRLRLGVHTGLSEAEVRADAAFAVVRRAPLRVPPADAAVETPPSTAPLHRYVSLFAGDRGATLYSDGLAEYEATEQGTVWITLLRAVGELSRNDLPERPGHAGWPTPTPGAQCHRPVAASLAVMLHRGDDDRTRHLIEQTADDVFLPLTGETLRSALHRPDPIDGVALEGEGLAFSALKESEDGEWIVARCVNRLDYEVAGAWRFGAPIREARLARLDETVVAELVVRDGVVEFRAGAYEVVTVLVR
jgi:mannosylglycerate hydrolase